MRKYLLIGALGVAAAGGFFFVSSRGDLGAGESGRVQRIGGRRAAPSGGPQWTIVDGHDFTQAAPDPFSFCSGDSHCKAALTFDKNGHTVWRKSDGSARSGNTDHSATATLTGFGAYAGTILGDLDSPELSDQPDLDSLLGGDYTVVAVGYGADSTGGGGNGVGVFVEWGDTNGSLALYAGLNASGTLNCNGYESSTYYTTQGAGGVEPIGRFATDPFASMTISMCRRAGNTRVARSNGTNGTPNTTAGTRAVPVAGPIAVGGYHYAINLSGYYLNGQLVALLFFDQSKSDAWAQNLETSLWRTPGNVGIGVGDAWGQVDGTGTVWISAPAGYAATAANGLHAFGNDDGAVLKNAWATQSTDLSTATQVGTPTLTASVDYGPYSQYFNGAKKGQRFCDTSAVAQQGYVSEEMVSTHSSPALANHWYACAFTLAAADAGTTFDQAEIKVVTDGTATPDHLNITGMTYAPADNVLIFKMTGNPTTVKCQLLQGTTAAQQGCVNFYEGETSGHAGRLRYTINDTARGISQVNKFSAAPVPTGWSNGKIELIWRPRWNPRTAWASDTDVIYLLDAWNTIATHRVIFIPGYTVAGRTLVRTTNDTSTTEFDIDTLDFVPGHTYASAVVWTKAPDGTHCYVYALNDECSSIGCAHTIVASDESGAGICPGPADFTSPGCRYDTSICSDVDLLAYNVFTRSDGSSHAP
jgi:hypothetical protein